MRGLSPAPCVAPWPSHAWHAGGSSQAWSSGSEVGERGSQSRPSRSPSKLGVPISNLNAFLAEFSTKLERKLAGLSERLQSPPSVGVLLRQPTTLGDTWKSTDLESDLPADAKAPSDEGRENCQEEMARRPTLPNSLQVVADAQLTYFGSPRLLLVVQLAHPGPGDSCSAQLQQLAGIIDSHLRYLQPEEGPWTWPLHDLSVCAAIVAAHLVQAKTYRYSMLWKVLWFLRLAPPPGGPAMEAQLTRHYGSAVGYVFAWTNLYIRGLWALAVTLAVFYLVGTDATEAGMHHPLWWILQGWTLVWAQVMAFGGYKRHRVLKAGGGLLRPPAADFMSRVWGKKRPGKVQDLNNLTIRSFTSTGSVVTAASDVTHSSGVNSERDYPVEAMRSPASCDSERRGATKSSAASSELLPISSEAESYEHMRTFSEEIQAPNTVPGQAGEARPVAESPISELELPDEAMASRKKEAAAAMRIQARLRGNAARRELYTKLRTSVVVARYHGCEVLTREGRRNPSYQLPPLGLSEQGVARWEIFIRVRAAAIAALVIPLFVALALAILIVWTQVNAWIIYVWGDCRVLSCRDPQMKHGYLGILAEMASDVSLALVFDVVMGEACKALSEWLVSWWNFPALYKTRYTTHMLSLFIEVMSKVGMLVILAFVVVPRWLGEPAPGQGTAQVFCKGLPDWEMCSALFGCGYRPMDAECCGDVILCLTQRLPFDKRRSLFERSMRGPFMVAPFIRIVPTVIVPWITAQLNKLITVAGQAMGDPRKKVCRAFTAPLVRLLALIFNLDCESVGCLWYVFTGWPFKVKEESATPLVQSAVEQSVRKVFEPLDELMEVKMNFIFVIFFAPVMPLGIAVTLAARLLEIRTKLTKLFIVRRRCFPEDARLVHDTQRAFTLLAAHLGVIWHIGLNCVAYYEDLSEHPREIVGLWLGSSIGVMLLLYLLRRLLERRWRPFQGMVIERILHVCFPS